MVDPQKQHHLSLLYVRLSHIRDQFDALSDAIGEVLKDTDTRRDGSSDAVEPTLTETKRPCNIITLPVFDSEAFTVTWYGQCRTFGPTLPFKLLRRLAKRPNRYVGADVLLQEVWCDVHSWAAERSVVKVLQGQLNEAGMHDLATGIRGRNRCYGLFLPDAR